MSKNEYAKIGKLIMEHLQRENYLRIEFYSSCGFEIEDIHTGLIFQNSDLASALEEYAQWWKDSE